MDWLGTAAWRRIPIAGVAPSDRATIAGATKRAEEDQARQMKLLERENARLQLGSNVTLYKLILQ